MYAARALGLKGEKKIIVIPVLRLRNTVVCFYTRFEPKMSGLNVYLLKLVWFSFPPTVNTNPQEFLLSV